jgi:NTP pyrophosphatase (non-canonical NTP hydrolase)
MTLEQHTFETTEHLLSLNHYQQAVHDWFQQKRYDYWRPMAITTQLLEECGELTAILNRTYGEKRWRKDETPKKPEDELGDVYYALICFANKYSLELDQISHRHASMKGPRQTDDPLEANELIHEQVSSFNRVVRLTKDADHGFHTSQTIHEHLARVLYAIDDLVDLLHLDVDVAMRHTLHKVMGRDRDRFLRLDEEPGEAGAK